MFSSTPIERVAVSAYTIPTSEPESDGTLAWDATTLVVVEIDAGGKVGFGYTYADTATARLVQDKLAPILRDEDALAVRARWDDMVRSIRNLGRPGIASMAISAADTALWDLKAKLYDTSLALLLGLARPDIRVYGSGGFTSYDLKHLEDQLRNWARAGTPFVKMKVGRAPAEDIQRVQAAREAIGGSVGLFVDANGAYTRKEALQFAEAFVAAGVSWFEEPVSSDDLPGLNLIRDRAPAGMAITAGEYGYDLPYFERMAASGAVDVLQADATRCAGVTGFMSVAAICDAHGIPLSSHCAPTLHRPLCCAASRAIHLEYFHDHVRIEGMLFDGAAVQHEGRLAPDLSRPGLGIDFKRSDAKEYEVGF